mgnify:CR=1 FL=1
MDASTAQSVVATRKKRTRYFETYIGKVLKKDSGNQIKGITSNAKQQFNSFLCIVARAIVGNAVSLTELSQKRTISDKEIKNAVGMMVSAEFHSKIMTLCELSLKAYNECETTGCSRQEKANIVFPPSIAEKFIRGYGLHKIMVTSNSPLVLAVALEAICSRLMEGATKSACSMKRCRVTIRDLEMSAQEDPDIGMIMHKNNISFLGGGVVPYLHPSLKVKPAKRKKKAVSNDDSQPVVKKSHRFRPGTVAVREIRKYQRTSNCLTFPKYPFEKIVRNLIEGSSGREDKVKVSKEVFTVLQYFIEQQLVGVLTAANKIAIHSQRIKVIAADIRIVQEIRNELSIGELKSDKDEASRSNSTTKEEHSDSVPTFEEIDTNNDGVISKEEWVAAMK